MKKTLYYNRNDISTRSIKKTYDSENPYNNKYEYGSKQNILKPIYNKIEYDHDLNIDVENIFNKNLTHEKKETTIDRFLFNDPEYEKHFIWDDIPRGGYSTRNDK